MIDNINTCFNCKTPITEKNLYKLRKLPNDPWCKSCVSLHNEKYKDFHQKEKKKIRSKGYYQNVEKFRKEKRDYYKTHKEEKRLYDIEYRKKNKDKIKQKKQEWAIRNKNNPLGKLKLTLRRRIRNVLQGKEKRGTYIDLLGCTPEFFMSYIESLWQPGMTWENRGFRGWHLDHIIPCYTFDLSKEEDQKKCFHYTNQRPLWMKDNVRRPRPDYYRILSEKKSSAFSKYRSEDQIPPQ